MDEELPKDRVDGNEVGPVQDHPVSSFLQTDREGFLQFSTGAEIVPVFKIFTILYILYDSVDGKVKWNQDGFAAVIFLFLPFGMIVIFLWNHDRGIH